MTRPEYSYKRDMTFHINRRQYGRDAPSTDIDFLEFDNYHPVLLWELKSVQSKWKSGHRTASMVPQFILACRARIEYRVVENNKDWSELVVYSLRGWYKKQIHGSRGPYHVWIPIIESRTVLTLPEFVCWLYEIRGRTLTIAHGFTIEHYIPDSLKPIIFSYSHK